MATSKKRIIIVTGSAGRIGSRLIARIGNKYRIIGFELLHALYASANEELVPVDISSDESVAQAFQHIRNFYGNHIVSVVHLAAYYSFSDQNYKKYRKITVEGTKRLLIALQDFNVEQFIFSSTMLVHKPSTKKINEHSPRKARWAYPRSKIETEDIIHKYRGKIPTVILRIAGVYDEVCHSIPIAQQIQRIYEHQLTAHFFSGNLSHGASFLHMEDLIDALVLCIEKRKQLPKETTLLLGEPETLSTGYLQRKISSLLFGKEIHTWRVPKKLAWLGAWLLNHIPFTKKPFIKPWMTTIADDNYNLDVSKAQKVLGWVPRHRLSNELEPIIQLLLEYPKEWYATNQLVPPAKGFPKKERKKARKAA